MSSVNYLLRAGELDGLLRRGEIVPVTPSERFFVFLDSSETPFLHKIGAVALPLILAVAASILMKFSLLGSIVAFVTAVVLTSVFYAYGEENLQGRAIDARVERAQRRLDELTQAHQEAQARYDRSQRRLDELTQTLRYHESLMQQA